MPDPKFFIRGGPYSLAVIAAKCGAELVGPDDGEILINDIAPLDQAVGGQLSFLDNKKYRDQFSATKAEACIVHPNLASYAPAGVKLLLSQAPYKTYALASQLFYEDSKPGDGISDKASIHASARIGANAFIGDFAVIGEGVEIGENAWIEPHAVIADNVTIGKNVRIGPHASLSHSLIGDNTRIYPGCRIGQDGFGFAIDPTGFVKVPQLGRVIIEGYSEIGANTCIDRGSMGDTVIGKGSWIDNQVQIGHNVKTGKGCVIVSQVGISGSTELGDYVVLAGQVGIAGHLKIGAGSRIGAKSGILQDVPPKSEIMGFPAVPVKQFFRQNFWINKMIQFKNNDALK